MSLLLSKPIPYMRGGFRWDGVFFLEYTVCYVWSFSFGAQVEIQEKEHLHYHEKEVRFGAIIVFSMFTTFVLKSEAFRKN